MLLFENNDVMGPQIYFCREAHALSRRPLFIAINFETDSMTGLNVLSPILLLVVKGGEQYCSQLCHVSGALLVDVSCMRFLGFPCRYSGFPPSQKSKHIRRVFINAIYCQLLMS